MKTGMTSFLLWELPGGLVAIGYEQTQNATWAPGYVFGVFICCSHGPVYRSVFRVSEACISM